MSYPGDALNAFSGIMSLLETEFQTNFVAGLPDRNFVDCLLWRRVMPLKSLVRRELKGDKCQFPSWSWAGWEGEVMFFLSRPLPAKERVHAQYNQAYDILKRRLLHSQQSIKSASQIASVSVLGKEEARDTPETSLQLLTSQHFLGIKSSVLSLSKFEYLPTGIMHKHTAHIIFDTSKRRCGLLFLDYILDGVDAESQPLKELLLVSRHSSAKDFKYTSGGDATERYASQLDEKYFGTGFCTFLVIEQKGTYMERIGMGYIAAPAWEQAEPEPKEVVLG
jgi:hypothetical protein